LFKTRLRAEADRETEQLKNALQITASEHQIRFEKLYERRAIVVADLYELLVEMHDAGARFAFQHSTENLEMADEKRRALYTFYARQRIYIPEHLCELLDKMVDEISRQTVVVDVYRDGYSPTSQALAERNKAMIDAVRAYEQEIPKLKKAVDTEFRKLLGETAPKVGIEQPANG
jgi:hypothetical protein